MLRNPSTKYRPFPPVGLGDRTWPNRVISVPPDLVQRRPARRQPGAGRADGTGAQAPKLFDTLVKLGFKEIEVGFPAASQTDFDFVRQIIEPRT
jgi:2-isopropylmalate synthase